MSKHFTIPWPHRPQSRERKQSGGRRSTCAIISLLVGLLFLLKVSEIMICEEFKKQCLRLQVADMSHLMMLLDRDFITTNVKNWTLLIKIMMTTHNTEILNFWRIDLGAASMTSKRTVPIFFYSILS